MTLYCSGKWINVVTAPHCSKEYYNNIMPNKLKSNETICKNPNNYKTILPNTGSKLLKDNHGEKSI